ncbi:unnamed protein product [Medioppia subpectinata]|uniref:ABC-type glutathione-S-conjugate transporter n=1 Tax=Medioppia subpectinata TaxID=1979941 RepID=A0A7R9PUR4_9ACAR|nr:unnamed protein product [Medioppia subpectinata]CAG2101812.1 unnamed protein product [Medioppia subpectinata]
MNSLKLSSCGRKDFISGEIINLMSVDIQRIIDFILLANYLWSTPFYILIASVLLWQQLGVATLAGLAFLVILLPFNACIGHKVKKYQTIQMRVKDHRIKVLNELLNGIKVLKLYAWEKAFKDQVCRARDQEVKALNTKAIYQSATIFMFYSAHFFIGLISFITFILISPNNNLDANKAKSHWILSYITNHGCNGIKVEINQLRKSKLEYLEMGVITTKYVFEIFEFTFAKSINLHLLLSLNRINKFINANEVKENTFFNNKHKTISISIINATFSWDKHIPPVLNNISMEVFEPKLVAVVGLVGAGKSSLLSALLGELEILEGSACVEGSVAYVPQEAWIQNKTLKENIVFTNELNDEYYERVLESCALVPDLAQLPDRDLTEIGEKGINLSGGQKQRVSMARAVYANRDIYLLDDPFSAVDTHVGKHLFEKTIGRNGLLKDKIRILVTNSVSILPNVDQIVVIKNGYVFESGTFENLISKNGYFSEFMTEYLSQQSDNELKYEDKKIVNKLRDRMKCLVKKVINQTNGGFNGSGDGNEWKNLIKQMLNNLREKRLKEENMIKNQLFVKTSGKLTEIESSETSCVGFKIYKKYITLIGLWFCAVIIGSSLASTMAQILSGLWLSEWSDDSLDSNHMNDTNVRYIRLGVYAGIGVFDTVFTFISQTFISFGCIGAAKHLHNIVLDRIIRAPISFYAFPDTTPIGRIQNRFSRDMDSVDYALIDSLRMTITIIMRAFVAIFLITFQTPLVLTAILPLFFLYIRTSRQLKRIESTTRSPIYSHFSETVSGYTSIRAYGVSHQFIQESNRRVDENHMCYYPSFTASQWLAIRLELLGHCIVFLTAIFIVYYRFKLSPGIAGLAISYSLDITRCLTNLVHYTSNLETNIISVERCLEYTETPIEAEWYNEVTKPLPDWPEKGEIKFSEYSTRYREGLDLVLKTITLEVKPKEKVGIVGRTGAGKSSLTLALFRLIEPVNGSIRIDSVDIKQLGLYDLRSRITIIPQDPALFTGTLRLNLDPFNRYSDTDIWRALESAHLKQFVDTLKKGLSHEISEGGENLSVGQKQLICLARALLRKTKILVLDEATAAVDMETDDLIQQTIRKEFCLSTIVTIAHRLNTIIDYDKVLVMDKGMVAEFDSPHHLLQNTNSIFYSMAKEANFI